MQVEMTIKGLMVDPVHSVPIVVLQERAGERVLPIWVGHMEASAILSQIENLAPPRPMTHDLLRNLIEDLDAQVDRVVVHDLRENTFYALIHLARNGEPIAIDARPSDAIALALRSRAPIYVEESVLESASTADTGKEKGDEDLAKLQRWLESLGPDDLGKYKM